MPATYAGVSGTNRKLTKIPVGVSGVNRECKSVWAGVSSVNRQVFSSGQPISNLSVGNIVKCTIDGTLREFIVVHKGKPSDEYNSDCDGIWLMSKHSHVLYQWNPGGEVGVEKTTSYNYLNTTYYNAIQPSVRSQILRSTHFQRDYNTWGINDVLTYQAYIFLCTADEAGGSSTNGDLGSKLDYFENTSRQSDLRKCTDYSGSVVKGWWTSSAQYRSNMKAHEVKTFYGDEGDQGSYFSSSNVIGLRPFFILPHTALIGEKAESDGSYILQ